VGVENELWCIHQHFGIVGDEINLTLSFVDAVKCLALSLPLCWAVLGGGSPPSAAERAVSFLAACPKGGQRCWGALGERWPSHCTLYVPHFVALALKLVDAKGFDPQMLTEASMERRNPTRNAEDRICVDRGLTEGVTHAGGSAGARAVCLDYSSQERAQHRLLGLRPSSSPWQT